MMIYTKLLKQWLEKEGFLAVEKPVAVETATYRLLLNDWQEDPSFYRLEPKKPHDDEDWAQRCLSYLNTFSEKANMTGVPRPASIIHQEEQTLSFYYLDGYVRVSPVSSKIYIQITHPYRDVVVNTLVLMAKTKRKESPVGNKNVTININ